jgi:Flp pilus assembly protein TadG
VEFALVMPLFVLTVVTMIGVTAVCLDAIRLHDMARTAVRSAVTTDDPVRTVAVMMEGKGVRVETTDDLATRMVTVTLSRSAPGLGWLARRIGLSATVTMMREAPPVLQR